MKIKALAHVRKAIAHVAGAAPLATLAAWWFFPAMDADMASASTEKLDGVFVGLGSFYLMLLLIYHVLPPGSGQGTIWDDKV